MLEDRRVDVSNTNNDGYNVLHSVAEFSADSAKLIDLVLKRGDGNPNFEVNARVPATGRSALHLAAHSGRKRQVRRLLQDERVNPSLADHAGNTALHLAAWTDKKKSAQYLMRDARVNVNARNNDHETPMHIAVRDGVFETVKTMLRCPRVDLTLTNADDESPLHLAARSTIRIYGAMLYSRQHKDFGAKNGLGELPLHITVGNMLHGDCRIEETCERTANFGARTNDGSTALHCAVRRGYVSIVRTLIEFDLRNTSQKQIDVNARLSDGGDTALHLAMKYSNEGWERNRIVKELLKHPRVDASLRNDCGTLAQNIPGPDFDDTFPEME